MNKNVFHPNSITLSFSCFFFFVFQIPCTPNSPNFQCMGLGMFANVPSVGPWCVEKCKKNACVDSVCQCSCPSQALGIDDTILFIYIFFLLTLTQPYEIIIFQPCFIFVQCHHEKMPI